MRGRLGTSADEDARDGRMILRAFKREVLNSYLRWRHRRLIRVVETGGAFDSEGYRRRYPDVAEAMCDPLVHFATRGVFEGRRPVWKVEDLSFAVAQGKLPLQQLSAPWSDIPSEDDWGRLISRRSAKGAGAAGDVRVIIPVFLGCRETLRCLFSVLSSACGVSHDVVVIDDASPDAELSSWLGRLADAGLFRLIRHRENLGFPASVNEVAALDPCRDIVVLNGDTEVYDGWLDRLRGAALADDDIGTATPLTNSGSYCTYSHLHAKGNAVPSVEYAGLDALAAVVNAGVRVVIPTAVGFCMYVKARCFEEAGGFDVAAFGRGYGEEDDFCFRARALGWRHVAACDVFVRHTGVVSSSSEREGHIRRATEILAARHPSFSAIVGDHLERDPLRIARFRLDGAVARQERQKGTVLAVGRFSGARADVLLRNFRERCRWMNLAAMVMRVSDDAAVVRLEFLRNDDVKNPNYEDIVIRDSVDRLAVVLRGYDVCWMCADSRDEQSIPWMPELSATLGLCIEHFSSENIARGLRAPLDQRERSVVAMITHNLDREGASSHVVRIAVHLAREGVVTPVVFSPVDGPHRLTLQQKNIEVVVRRGDIKTLPFRREMWSRRPSLIFANTLLTYRAILGAHVRGIPSLWDIHESEGVAAHIPAASVAWVRRAFTLPFRVIFPCDAARRIYAAYEGCGHFEVIPNAIAWDESIDALSDDARQEARKVLEVDNEDSVVVNVGTVCENKGQMDIVAAVERLWEGTGMKRPLRLFLVGDRGLPYGEQLRNRIAGCPPALRDRIAVVPHTGDVGRYYAAADLFVLSSKAECAPLVILEAMAYGLPIVASRVGGVPEQVREGVNAEFFPPGDVDAMAAKMAMLIQDPALSGQYREASPAVLRSLPGIHDMMQRYSALFREAVLASAC